MSISLHFEDPRLHTLDRVTSQFEQGEPIIHVKGLWRDTKDPILTDTEFYLSRQVQLEQRVRDTIEGVADFCEIAKRFSARYHESECVEYPRHYPVRLLDARKESIKKSIFTFLPWAAGIAIDDERYQYGAEFTNVWEQVFHACVFPVVGHILDLDSQLAIHQSLLEGIDKISATASIFHELGHRHGPFKVSPRQHPRMALRIGETIFDACGELTTDALTITLIPELPELATFILLYRLFYFPRKGWSESAGSNIHADNDALLGPLIWRIARRSGVIVNRGDRFHLDLGGIPAVFQEALNRVDELGFRLLVLGAAEQKEQAIEWMRAMVDYDSQAERFVAPEDLSVIYCRLDHVPETSFQSYIQLY